MTTLVVTVTEIMRYRGAIGQWSWVLHRITGLGVVLFLTLHVIDTSWAVFYPEKYVEAIASYQSPLFTIGEFALVACVVYHAINGLRIILLDYRPHLWQYQQRAAYIVLAVTGLILVPVFILMFSHVLNFYSSGEPVLPLTEVIVAQLPFLAGFVVAGVAALFYSVVHGAIAGDTESKAGGRPAGSSIERFWWSFMRISGLLIVPLVFGHLAMMHVLQGVFDITAQGYTIVGTGGIINESGTAVEFVANRWNLLVGGVAIWRLYDFALLALVVTHGFNGLRYVLTDYTMSSPLLRRASIYLCVIAGVVLLMLGTGALLGTIDQTAIEMAQQAAANLHP
ncbi:MAG TPA: succinate dehydrogenase, cytochrome b556 subunit [Spirillospora sp.]|nr:succinate dehydrogenase, cytochrome b556 subunit [Spirillospora sp.]